MLCYKLLRCGWDKVLIVLDVLILVIGFWFVLLELKKVLFKSCSMI